MGFAGVLNGLQKVRKDAKMAGLTRSLEEIDGNRGKIPGKSWILHKGVERYLKNIRNYPILVGYGVWRMEVTLKTSEII